MVGRRELIRRGFGLVAVVTIGDVIAACGPAAVSAPSIAPTAAATLPPTPSPLPPPETTIIRLSPGACDAPLILAEKFLKEEGFTDIQYTTVGGIPSLTDNKADLAAMFAPTLATGVDGGAAVISIGGLHPGCAEIWAPPGVATLKDLKGHTVIVRSKAPSDLAYSYMAIGLKNAGVDPSEVNFVVQADADLTKLFLEGKSDLLFLATTAAFGFRSNPANKGKVVLDQAMAEPWAGKNCCVLTTTTAWLKANPVAAKRTLRAIYRAADSAPKDRAEAAKIATDKGLFGGAANVELARGAANMVSYDWRKYDVTESMKFHADLLGAVGLLKGKPEDAVTKSLDLRFAKELANELKT